MRQRVSPGIHPPPVFYWAFGGVGILLFAIVSWLFLNDQQKMGHYVAMKGTVTDNQYEGGHAVVSYEWHGEEREYVSNVSSSPPAYDIGETVEVLVNPGDPSDVMINSFIDRFLGITILGGLGSVFLGLCLLFYFLSGRK